jgi:hypothetical protein
LFRVVRILFFLGGIFAPGIAAANTPDEARFERGVAKRRTGDTSGGNADVAAAKELDPKLANTMAKLLGQK